MSQESRLSALEADKSASLSPNELPIKQDISDSDFVYIHNTSTGKVERVSKSVFNADINSNGVESYYISPEPTPQTENFFIDVIVADNINNRAQQIPQSSKLIYIYTLFQYGGQSFRKIWVLDNSNRAYGQGTPPIGSNNLIEFNTQALQQNSVVDLGDIGALVGNETYEEHLRDYINAQDPSIGLINSGTIRADFGGDVREFNFSNVTGDYGLNVNQTDVSDFQLYGESNNEEDAGTIVTNTSQLVNDGEDGSSRFIEEDELGTIAYEDSDQFIKQQEREIPNGIATLDSIGKLKTDQIPDLAITDVVTPTETTIEAFVANNANYTYQQGDVIIIDDGSGDVTHNMYKGGDKSLVTSYSEINATEFAISQINGLQGELDDKVDLTSNQTVAGLKTFVRALTINASSGDPLTSNALASFRNPATNIAFQFGANSEYAWVRGADVGVASFGILKFGLDYIKLGSLDGLNEVDININTGSVTGNKFATNGGDGTNLIDDNGDLVPKSTFATSEDKDIYNLIIGGVGGAITSKALLASKFTFTESEVLLFKIFNNDVYAYINVEYNLNTSAFNADTNITYFIDKGKLINTGNQSFLNATNLEYFEAKNIELIDNNTFRGCTSLTFDNIKVRNVKTINGANTFRSILGGGLFYVPLLTSINGATPLETFRFTSIDEIYAPKLEQLGVNALDNDLFLGLTGNPKITLDYSLRFNNNGGKDGDIVVAENAGANIIYANVPNIATVTVDTLTELDLTNPNGNFCNHSSANSTETYTILNSIAGNKTEVLVNAVNEPTITGATKVSSDLFISNTDIYMIVEVKPHRVEYYFKQI